MSDAAPVPLSALQHYSYSPCQCALIHLEQAFAENLHTPRDRMNALLSFSYSLLMNDCRGAVEAAGLDPQIGFVHALRPGRAVVVVVRQRNRD